MKKLAIAAAGAALCAVAAHGSPVDSGRAAQAARAFMVNTVGVADARVASTVAAAPDAGYYIFNMSPRGWVVVSADDAADAILGYNTTGQLQWHSLPPEMAGYLNLMGRDVKTVAAKRSGVQAQEWKAISRQGGLRAMRSASRSGANDVAPLIQVNWNQGAPFNKYCPSNSTSKSYVGCIAVSMSQAMSVQKYPPRPQGTASGVSAEFGAYSIDFDTQDPYDWTALIANPGHDDVARLLRDAGYSVQMDYGKDGSGIPSTQVHRIANGLVNNFSYGRDDVKFIWQASYTGDWEALILNEIQAGRAVVYNAIDRKGGYGHSFNIDGYQEPSLFHVNWGWGGTGDGYFKLNALRDESMGMNYDSDHVAVIGIGSPDRVLRSVELSESVIDEGLAPGTVVGLITVNGAEPQAGWEITVRGPYNGTGYDAVPFDVKDGCLVATQTLTAREKPYELTVTVTGAGERLAWNFPVTVCKLRTLSQATSMTYDRATGAFLVKTRNNTSYTLTNSAGSVVAQGSLSPVPHIEFNKAQLTSGANILTITAGGESKTIKILK